LLFLHANEGKGVWRIYFRDRSRFEQQAESLEGKECEIGSQEMPLSVPTDSLSGHYMLSTLFNTQPREKKGQKKGE